MPYNILLLPLVGGYYILLNFIYFKYKYQRLSSQRILFGSIVCSIFLIIVVFSIRVLVSIIWPTLIPSIFQVLNKIPVTHYILLWTGVFSFLFAVIGTTLANSIFTKFNYFNFEDPVSYAVKKYGDELEYLFRESAINGFLIQCTLKNNKVYVGFATYIPPPKETNYLKLTPIISGYRDNNTKKLTLTTDYFEVVDKYLNNSDNQLPDMDIIIKQDEILSANVFDPTMYKLFNNIGEPENN